MERMYKERKGNIAAFRGCGFHCCYCAFQKMLKLSKCQECRDFKPHSHMEVLQRKPPKTRQGEFLTVGLASDISFMDVNDFCDVLDYCSKWEDRTFLIQSKNPGYFLQFAHKITSNVIIGTTIESNRLITDRSRGITTCFYDHDDCCGEPISQAPSSNLRYEAMKLYNGRKSVTVEPIIDFSLDILHGWVESINPEFCYVGYNSLPKLRLPEPPLAKTRELIIKLQNSGIKVYKKLMRRAWYE